jgi:hypothetical protein
MNDRRPTAEFIAGLKHFWSDVKSQEQQNVQRLKELIGQEVRNGCF